MAIREVYMSSVVQKGSKSRQSQEGTELYAMSLRWTLADRHDRQLPGSILPPLNRDGNVTARL